MSAGSVSDSIVTFCKKCGAQLRAPANLAGKRGKCAQCGAAILVPLKSEAPPTVARGAADAPAEEAKKTDETPRKPLNMVLVALLATVVGLGLALGIYAVFLMGPSGSILPPPPVPLLAEFDPEALAPAPTPETPSGESRVPRVIDLQPGPPKSTNRTAPGHAPSPGPRPSPSPEPKARPWGDGRGRPGMKPGPEMRPGSQPGPGSGPSMHGPGAGRPGYAKSLDVWDAIHQGLISVTLTAKPDKTVDITAKREMQMPFVVTIKKGIRPFATSATAQISVQAVTDVFLDLRTNAEATATLPLVGEATAKTLTIAAEKRPPAEP